MSRITFISAGSTTLVASGGGNLYGVAVDKGNGATVLVADSLNLGATPDYNAVNQTGLMRSIGTLQTAGPYDAEFKGAHFSTGLSISASSTARVTVTWSE